MQLILNQIRKIKVKLHVKDSLPMKNDSRVQCLKLTQIVQRQLLCFFSFFSTAIWELVIVMLWLPINLTEDENVYKRWTTFPLYHPLALCGVFTASLSLASRCTMAEVFHLKTPLLESINMSKRVGTTVYLKMENAQPSGSFKIRGIGHLCQQVGIFTAPLTRAPFLQIHIVTQWLFNVLLQLARHSKGVICSSGDSVLLNIIFSLQCSVISVFL